MIAATLVVAGTIITYVGTIDLKMPLALFGASLFIATVGLADDVKSIPVLPRLALQALAVGAMTAGLAAGAFAFDKRAGQHFAESTQAADEFAAQFQVGFVRRLHMTLMIVS